MIELYDNFFHHLVLFLAVGMVPFVIMVTTSFIKISIVLNIIRNAIGVQQIPPNLAIYAIAMILTVYIMYPVGVQTYRIAKTINVDFKDFNQLTEVFPTVIKPWKTFIAVHTREVDLVFFKENTEIIWPEEFSKTIKSDSLILLIPAFLISELTNAFEIGFMVYLPFLIIDLVISNILLSLGMMMVSPMTISLPFKILVFVLADGWSRLIQNLAMSYQV